MRSAGTLIKWNDDRGFGFILPNQTGDEIFVHISAFPQDGVRPTVGEIVSYETLINDGKTRAVSIIRPTKTGTRKTQSRSSSRREENPWITRLIGLMFLLVAGYFIKNQYQARSFHVAEAQPIESALSKHSEAAPAFACDGRIHCSEMRSEEEAIFFIQNCPNTKMDGDGDGQPCESQF
ncbi:MAG: cold shock domain-containing protein [Arenimonas sp.]